MDVPREAVSSLPLAEEAGPRPHSAAGAAPLSPAGRLPPTPTDSSPLLKTLSVAGGRSRAGSVAGWESLEGYENAMSEMTSEASTMLNAPFGLKPIPASALPTTPGR